LLSNNYKRFQEAEEDCNKSLTLDPTFVKAYHRRGTARNSLGKLDLAKKDFEKVLSLEPHNKAAQMELERIVKLIDQSASKVLLETEKNSPSEESGILNITDSKPQGPTKSVNYSHVVEKKVEQFSSKSYVVEEYVEPVVSTEKPKEKLQQLPIVSVHNGKQEEVAVAKIIKGFAPKKDETTEISIPKPVTEVKPDGIAPVPKTYFQFHKEWQRLQKYSDLQFQYLRVS
jgi:RNA polymerase II-associated protein 3